MIHLFNQERNVTMNLTKKLRNQEGFTLVEIIAVLIILGILAAVAVPRYINLETRAKDRAIDAAIAELNGRENLIWANTKIGSTALTSANIDTEVWTAMSAELFLGNDYDWNGSESDSGGTLSFQASTGVGIDRTAAQLGSPGVWTRTPLSP
jgi:prepilin-type N-terminal cleavage/methylation domain-containing protein